MLARLIIILLLPLLSYSQNWNIAIEAPLLWRPSSNYILYDNYGFVISGSNTDNTFRYDKNTDSWTQLANFPGGVEDMPMVLLKRQAYMGFGSGLKR